MNRRGWTEDSIREIANNPHTTRNAFNKARNNPATAFFNRDGNYVVIDNVTWEVVQISHKFDLGWSPDSIIINLFIPR